MANKDPLLTALLPPTIRDLWNYAVAKQDRSGLSFKDLQDNFGEWDAPIAVYKAYRKTLQRRLIGVQERINAGLIEKDDALRIAELRKCCRLIKEWA